MLNNNDSIVRMSSLGKTWILDLDGTIVKHNGYKIDGQDTFLDGAEEFLKSISEDDIIVFITSRTEDYSDITEEFLKKSGIRYNYIIYGAPYGERILMNDDKNSGLAMAYAFRTKRDRFPDIKVIIDKNL